MKLRPLDDKIIVKRIEVESTTKSGLYIPDDSKEKPQEGVVVSVGPGKRAENGTLAARFPLAVAPDDRILFGRYAGTEIKIDGEEFLILREDEILSVVEE